MTLAYAHQTNAYHLTSQAEEAARPAIENLQGWDEAVSEIHTWPEY
jgi:hypothetical protein